MFVRSRFDAYRAASKAVQAIFAHYDPNFSAMSLDEGILDITDYILDVETGHRHLENSVRDLERMNTEMFSFQTPMKPLPDDATIAERVVFEMRCKIFQETKLTASAGIGPNRRIAKIGSGEILIQ